MESNFGYTLYRPLILVKVQTSLHPCCLLLHEKMEYKGSVLLTTILILVLVNCEDSSVKPSLGGPYNRGPCVGCRTRMIKCCGGAISNYFQSSQFENIFSKRNSLEAHAVSFWNYQSFVTASAQYQPYGFGTTYWKLMGMKEVAAFLAHVASKTSCEFRVSVLWSLIWAFVFSVWSNIS